MALRLVALFALLFAAVSVNCQRTVIVDVPDLGKIQGGKATTTGELKIEFWSFLGIPYAEESSYTGDNRFQPSVLKETQLPPDQDDVFIANKFINMCPQNAILDFNLTDTSDPLYAAKAIRGAFLGNQRAKKLIRDAKKNGIDFADVKNELAVWGKEACLVINVNTPKIPTDPDDSSELKPVILFIHGGGSDSIWGSIFAGFRLIEADVVLVNINYRLGVLGAFNLQIDEAPGNLGLYDCKTSLEWIQKYIKYFGGDPNRVTVTGQSAGAMMTSFLMVAPLSKDLMHGAIGVSGGVLSVWALSKHPSFFHHLQTAHYSGCYPEWQNDPHGIPSVQRRQEVVACMKLVSPADMVAAMGKYKTEEALEGRLGYDARVISIQDDTITIPKMVTEHPLNILRRQEQANIPLIMGATRHDGSFPLEDIYQDFVVPNDLENNSTFIRNDLIPFLFETALGVDDPTKAMIWALINQYAGDAAHTDDLDSKIPGLLDMVTVMAFAAGGFTTVEYHSKLNPNSYYYSFDYDGLFTLYDFLWGKGSKTPGGICHTDDLLYTFQLFPLITQNDNKVAKRMVQYWGNFAHYGNPNGDPSAPQVWPPYDEIHHTFIIHELEDRIGFNARDHYIGASLELVGGGSQTTAQATASPTPMPTDGNSDETSDSSTTTTTTTTTQSPNGSQVINGSTSFLLFTLISTMYYQYCRV